LLSFCNDVTWIKDDLVHIAGYVHFFMHIYFDRLAECSYSRKH